MFLSFSIMPGCTTSIMTMMSATASITVPAVSDAATRSARSRCAERDGAGSGKDGNENAKSQRTAGLVSNIDKPGGSARIFFCDTNNARGGERGKGGALTDTDEYHRECYAGHVGDIYSQPVSQNIPTRVMKRPPARRRGLPNHRVSLRDGDGYHKVRNRHREKGNTSLNRCETVNNLEKLGNKKPEAQHGAKKKETGCVCSDTFPTRKQAQWHYRLFRTPFIQDKECKEESTCGNAIIVVGSVEPPIAELTIP